MTTLSSKKRNTLVRIDMDEISGQPGRFTMSYGFDNSELMKSLDHVGLINKPYIIKNDYGEIEIVTGFRRLISLQGLGVEKVDCFDLTSSGMSPYEMFRLSFHDNFFSREFNLVEKSMILNRLSGLVKNDNLMQKYISLLNIPFKEYELILKIEELNSLIKDLLASGHLNIKILETLINIDSKDALILIDWIIKLKLNHNYQIQFIENILDICRISKTSINTILNDEYFLNILTDSRKNIPQKARELINALREKRNPRISNYQKIFEKGVKKLQLPNNIKIKHSRYFETEGYQLEIDFKNGDELIKSIETLLKRDGLKNIKDPWLNE